MKDTIDKCLRRAVAVALVAGAMMVSACSALMPSLPNSAAVDVPGEWSVSMAPSVTPIVSASTPLGPWWGRFNDPLLVALVDEAMAHNRSIVNARSVLAQARALSEVQAAGLWPVLGASASAKRVQTHASGTNNFAAGFDASWELDVFGGRQAGVRAADAVTIASDAGLADVQISVAAEVAIDYLQLRCVQRRLALARAGLLSQQDTLQLTDWRRQAGLITVLELDQARTAVEQTRAQIPAFESALAQAESGLAVLSGQGPGVLRIRLAGDGESCGGLEAEKMQTILPAVPAIALRQRPDVRAAEARVASAVALVTQADAARLPDFSLGGSLGLNALSVSALPRAAAVVGTLLAAVNVPLFDGGARRGGVHIQQALLEQAGAAYAATVLAALKEVEDAIVALRSEGERLVTLRTAAKAAANAALLASQRYRSGVIDFQVVLDTQRVSLIAQDAVAVSTGEHNADQVRLYKALGGGWEPHSAGQTPLSTSAGPAR